MTLVVTVRRLRVQLSRGSSTGRCYPWLRSGVRPSQSMACSALSCDLSCIRATAERLLCGAYLAHRRGKLEYLNKLVQSCPRNCAKNSHETSAGQALFSERRREHADDQSP